MKSLIALLALALLVLPMLAGIGRIRRLPRQDERSGGRAPDSDETP